MAGPSFPTGKCHARINPGCLPPWHYFADPDWEPGRARRECCRRRANDFPRICYRLGENGLLDEDCDHGCGCCCCCCGSWGNHRGWGWGRGRGRGEGDCGCGHKHDRDDNDRDCDCPFPCDCRRDCGCFSDGCMCMDDECPDRDYEGDNGERPGELILRRMGPDNTPLFGSVFTIFDQDGRNIASVMSGQHGLARFHDLRRGAFRIVETVSPPGHTAVAPMDLTIAERGTAIINGQVVRGVFDVHGAMQ